MKLALISAIPLLCLPLLTSSSLNAADVTIYGQAPQRIYNPQPQPVYAPPPGDSRQYALTYQDLSTTTDELKTNLSRMSDTVYRYGPGSYQRLRADLGDLNSRIDDLHNSIVQNRPYTDVRGAFSGVQGSAANTDALMQSIKAHPPVRDSWSRFIDSLRHAETVFR